MRYSYAVAGRHLAGYATVRATRRDAPWHHNEAHYNRSQCARDFYLRLQQSNRPNT